MVFFSSYDAAADYDEMMTTMRLLIMLVGGWVVGVCGRCCCFEPVLLMLRLLLLLLLLLVNVTHSVATVFWSLVDFLFNFILIVFIYNPYYRLKLCFFLSFFCVLLLVLYSLSMSLLYVFFTTCVHLLPRQMVFESFKCNYNQQHSAVPYIYICFVVVLV